MPCSEPTPGTYDIDALKREREANKALYGIDATNEGVARAVACELGRLIFPEPDDQTPAPAFGRLLVKIQLSKAAVKWLRRHEAQDAVRLKGEEERRLVLAALRENGRCKDCGGVKEAHIFSEALSAAGGGVRCVCAMPDAAYCGCRGYVARGAEPAALKPRVLGTEICANCGLSRSRHDWRGERRGCDGFVGTATDV